MTTFSQAQGPVAITTPLGEDVLLLTDLEGREVISELFHLRLDLLAAKETPVRFEKIVGESVTVAVWLPDGGKRYFNGIVSSFTQGQRDDTFTHFRAEVVPRLWLLTKNAESRVFQDLSVPDILKEVLAGITVKFELFEHYDLRNYCVQYRESDFAFASRIMEEEGIYYFFQHAEGSHTLIVSDAPFLHPDLPGQPTVDFAGVVGWEQPAMRVTAWEKTQELRAGKYSLRDHCFELPDVTLEARQSISESVQAGTVTHKLSLGSDKLEIYDYPGGYAKRFDGIDRAGAERPADLKKIRGDSERTVRIRMEQESTLGIRIQGTSDCRHFAPGHVFTLTRHVDGDGPYLLTSVKHHARNGVVRSTDKTAFVYENQFTCIPAALPHRPVRITPKPTIAGTQTATVVGPAGQEIFCDKYGRVRVQFHWDRLGKKDADSSFWLRVTQPWAGGGFGSIALPRVGHEVVVGFLEGDPDQPLILGSVYNDRKMPPFSLPEHHMLSGFKSTSVGGNPSAHFSGLTFNDTKGSERVALYAEKDMVVNSENNHRHHVGHNQHAQIGHMSLTTVGGIPGGGGSGGGGGEDIARPGMDAATTDDRGKPEPAGYGNWKTSNGLLSAQSGLAGAMIYGVNSQDTMGFMHQITVGSAYQMCVDPFGPAWGFIKNPLAGAPVMGGPLPLIGGDVQVCFGRKLDAVYGPSISINHGDQITMVDPPSPMTQVLAALVPLLSLAYQICYGLMFSKDDDEQGSDRAAAFSASVLAIRLVNAALISSEKADRIAKLGKRTASATKEEAQLATCLTIAGSTLITDFAQKMIPDAKATKRSMTPEQGFTPVDNPNDINFVDGSFHQIAKHIKLVAAKNWGPKPDEDPTPSTISISAAGKGDDGVVFVNGTKGVTLTALPAAMVELTKKGIKVEGGPAGTLALHCGLLGAGPEIKLDPKNGIALKVGLSEIKLDPKDGITLKFGPSEITLASSGIYAQVGPSQIKLEPQAIGVDALNIKVKAKLKHEIKAMQKKAVLTISDLQIDFAKH